MLKLLKRIFNNKKEIKRECRDAKGRFAKGYRNGVKMLRDARGRYVKKDV
jgi:hypothetical protein